MRHANAMRYSVCARAHLFTDPGSARSLWLLSDAGSERTSAQTQRSEYRTFSDREDVLCTPPFCAGASCARSHASYGWETLAPVLPVRRSVLGSASPLSSAVATTPWQPLSAGEGQETAIARDACWGSSLAHMPSVAFCAICGHQGGICVRCQHRAIRSRSPRQPR